MLALALLAPLALLGLLLALEPLDAWADGRRERHGPGRGTGHRPRAGPARRPARPGPGAPVRNAPHTADPANATAAVAGPAAVPAAAAARDPGSPPPDSGSV